MRELTETYCSSCLLVTLFPILHVKSRWKYRLFSQISCHLLVAYCGLTGRPHSIKYQELNHFQLYSPAMKKQKTEN